MQCPLNLVYGSSSEEPIILPEALTPAIIQDAFDLKRLDSIYMLAN